MLLLKVRHRLCTCFAAFVAVSCMAAEPLTVLRVQGSNTIGSRLLPALVKGVFEARGLSDIQRAAVGENEWVVTAGPSQGPQVQARLSAHGTATGFAALAAGNTDLAAASRPIHEQERVEVYPSTGQVQQAVEQVIGIDGVAVIVHPHNPLRSLDAEQLAAVFAGTITRWEQLGTGMGPIHLYARDNRSGTWETFRDLVLAPRALALADGARRLESSEALSAAVSNDSQAIGFIGLPYVLQSRALAIGEGDARALPPTADNVATEDYLLSRRLYLYSGAGVLNPWASALLAFSQSAAGQEIVATEGFVAQQVHSVPVQPSAGMPGAYLSLARDGRRLTVNFRFAGASASLDSKALADVDRLASYLRDRPFEREHLVLVGFGDAKSEPGRAMLLSRLRAMTVRRELAKRGIVPSAVLGLGGQLPVASNAYESGRLRNRRVEVWVQPGVR